mgnify:CR=1 FL=1
MRQLRSSSLVPPGLIVAHAERDHAEVWLTLRHRADLSLCPGCGMAARRIHSHYHRLLADLPMAGSAVRLRLQARRFRGDAVGCCRRIFTERFDPDVLAPWARRTNRLDELVHHLAIALGGRPASRLVRRLMLPVSKDALLRVVRRHGRPRLVPPTVIGIDNWVWRRNQRYGTIICDLEWRRTIALLPDREPATARAWLAGQPQIAVVARDRGGGYALAASGALPEATQVADRWHLMENASRAFLDAVRRPMQQIRSAVGAATVDVALLIAAERIQYEGYLCREEANAAILRLRADGIPIKAIVRRTGHSRGLVRPVSSADISSRDRASPMVVRGERTDLFRTRESSLEVHLPWLEEQWSAGSRNGAELWRRLRKHGFRGSLRVVTEWATRRRRTERAPTGALGRALLSARTVARLMSVDRDGLSRSEILTVAAIENGVPLLVEARELIAR